MAAPQELRDAVGARLAQLGVAPPVDLRLERPRNPDHGDWAVNCFPLAKGSSYAGPALAAALADRLNAEPPAHLAKAEAVGGFLNLRLHPTWLHDVLRLVVAAGTEAYARASTGAGRTINITFLSTNPTGPRLAHPDSPAPRRPWPVGGIRRFAGPDHAPHLLDGAGRPLHQRPGRPARAV